MAQNFTPRPAASKTTVGLGSVDNTSDANKPVSNATQSALDAKATLASPALTGTPTVNGFPVVNVNDQAVALASVKTVSGSRVTRSYTVFKKNSQSIANVNRLRPFETTRKRVVFRNIGLAPVQVVMAPVTTNGYNNPTNWTTDGVVIAPGEECAFAGVGTIHLRTTVDGDSYVVGILTELGVA